MSRRQRRLSEIAKVCQKIAGKGKRSVGAEWCEQMIRRVDKKKRAQYRRLRG